MDARTRRWRCCPARTALNGVALVALQPQAPPQPQKNHQSASHDLKFRSRIVRTDSQSRHLPGGIMSPTGGRRTHVRGHVRSGRWVSGYTQYRQSGRGPKASGSGRRSSSASAAKIADLKKSDAERQMMRRKQKETERAAQTEQYALWKRDQDRIRIAADFCAAAFKNGAINAAADRVAGHVSDDAWKTLYRKWRPFRCKWLAELARELLETKAAIHAAFADVSLKLSGRTFRHEPERIFANQLLRNIPLPGDEQFIAAAHGVRLIGVYLCAVQERDLVNCACFRPLAVERSKEEVKQYLITTGTSWARTDPS